MAARSTPFEGDDASNGMNYTDDDLDWEKAREDGGHYDIEVFPEANDESITRWNNCEKNNGHEDFIPVQEFDLKHLPEEYQDRQIVDAVRVQAYLTVRLVVKYVSENRPETAPGSSIPYPFYSSRGRNVMRTGSGYVQSAYKFREDSQLAQECLDCAEEVCHRQHRFIQVITAKHLVFDDQEAESSSVEFCFDNKHDRASVQVLEDAIVREFDVGEDRAEIYFFFP